MIRIISLFILILFSSNKSSIVSDIDKKIEAEKYYQQALKFYEQGKCELATEQLKIALRLNKKLSKAYNQLAIIYMDEGTVYGRFKATIELEKALKLEPKNVEFRFNEAMLNLKKGFSGVAAKQLEKITKLDPQNYLAYFHIAKIKEQEMLHYADMISFDKSSDVVIPMQSFAEDIKEEAADYYKKTIAINPKFADAYYRLALIYYEFDNDEEMIQLLESAVKIIPDDKNCHLFLGFAYQNNNEFREAANEYELAKNLMSPQDREMLESIEYILTPDQKKNYATISKTEKQNLQDTFWRSKDPFYLTEANERELEHFSRIAYANLRFSKPEKHIEGWQTDRGKVMIRYGVPISKYRTRPYLGEFTGEGRNPLHHSKEVWIYPDFDFVFEDRYLSDNFNFAWGFRPGDDYKENYERLIQKFPDYYQLIPDSQFFNVPLDIVAFQGQSEKTDLEFCYTIPINEINSSDDQFNLRQGIFLFDESWSPVIQKTRDLLFQNDEITTINQEPQFNNHDLIEIKPGLYHFAFEFEDVLSAKKSKIHQDIQVRGFLANQFQISDILFANEVQPPNLNVSPARSDFKIIPNPSRNYRRGEPIVIYYELYHLTQDSNSETRFQIEYQVGTDVEALSSMKKLLTNLGIMKKIGKVTSSYEYTGSTQNELQYQKMLLDAKMIGRIRLTLKAIDLLTGVSVQKEESFTIGE